MVFLPEGLRKDNLVFLLNYRSFVEFVLNYTNIDDSNELIWIFFIVDFVSNFIVPRCYVVQDDIVYFIWKVFEYFDLLQIQSEKVSLLRRAYLLLAYFGNRHKFLLIALIHEISKAIFLSEPFRVLFIHRLSKIDSFGVWEAVVAFY